MFCQGPYDESIRYHDFMDWTMPWYSAQHSLDTLLVGRQIGLMHVVRYLRRGDRVLETYWTTRRGVETIDINYRLMDLTLYGRQEPWEDSPERWPQSHHQDTRIDGRPTAQWSRINAGDPPISLVAVHRDPQSHRRRLAPVVVARASEAARAARPAGPDVRTNHGSRRLS